MDLDDEELKATREANGTVSTTDNKIEDIVNKFNETCKELSEITGVSNIAIIGYVNVGDKHGFISSTNGLQSLESTTTFLLDFASMNIRESVKATASKNVEELKNKIEEIQNKEDIVNGK